MTSSHHLSLHELQSKAQADRKSIEECYHQFEHEPAVRKAIDAYDAILKKLLLECAKESGGGAEEANKTYAELEKARHEIQRAYELVHPSKTTTATTTTATTLESVKEKAGEAASAAQEKLVEAKEKLVG